MSGLRRETTGAQRRERIGARARLLLALVIASNAACLQAGDASDPMTEGDHFLLGRLLELLPGVPWVGAGKDRRFGSSDDPVLAAVVGDVDLVVRVGVTSIDADLPAPAPLRGGPLPEATCEPFSDGAPLDFAVTASNGFAQDGGAPVESPGVASVPVLAVAFADLDGDGFVGVTELDGDPGDADREASELDAIGRRFALASASRASGELFLSVGGPSGAEPRVVVTAAAFTGPTDPGHFGGSVPTGPAVLGAFPFLPRTDPGRVIDGNLPGPADPDERVGVEIEDVFTPDPSRPYGEAYTIPTDGSSPSVDVGLARSGAAVRFGAVRPAAAEGTPRGARLRPGLDANGARVLYEGLDALVLPTTDETPLRIVPLDRLGNVADLAASASVTLRATGRARIVAPDADSDTTRETLTVNDARGAAVTLDGAGAGSGAAVLKIEGGAGLSVVELLDDVAAD